VAGSGNGDDAGEYRPVSALAVAALGLGVLSALALVSRVAWALPLVAAAVAAVALADIGRPGVRKAGRWAALVALALAMGFGAQAVTTAVVGRAIATGRAAAAVRVWLDAIRTDSLADALAMCAADIRPPPAPDADDAAASRIAAFAALPAIGAVQACGGGAAVTTTVAAAGAGWTVRAKLEPCAEPADGDVTLAIDVEPLVTGGPRGPVEQWIVTRFARVP
jgi:hypothetical protein